MCQDVENNEMNSIAKTDIYFRRNKTIRATYEGGGSDGTCYRHTKRKHGCARFSLRILCASIVRFFDFGACDVCSLCVFLQWKRRCHGIGDAGQRQINNKSFQINDIRIYDFNFNII